VRAGKPSRIYALSADGSLGIYNPKTSENIIAALPPVDDVRVLCSVYDYSVGKLNLIHRKIIHAFSHR
jgi:hypothetical protein